ncbi:unnamed protein product [Brassica oleracea]
MSFFLFLTNFEALFMGRSLTMQLLFFSYFCTRFCILSTFCC